MASEAYPVIEALKTKSESPETAPPPPFIGNAIAITYGDTKASVDISAALSVEDVKHTLFTVFGLGKNARIIVKRANDGAIVIPGPKLAPGEYVLEEVDGHMKKAYKSIVQKHLPEVKQQLTERHIPFLVETSKVGANRLRDAASAAKQKTGEGLTVAGTHLSAAKENLGLGLAAAGTHFNSARAVATEKTSEALTVAGTHVKGHVNRAAMIINTHAVTKPHTWTAKLWLSIVSCIGGPLAAITGLNVDELARLHPETTAAISSAHSAAASTAADVSEGAKEALSDVTDKVPDSVTSITSEVPLSKAAASFLN